MALDGGSSRARRPPDLVPRRRRDHARRAACAGGHLPRRARRDARLRLVDRRGHRALGPGVRPVRPAGQRALRPPTRRRPVVLDHRAVRARARGLGGPWHRLALPRPRPVVGRDARAAARAGAAVGPGERCRGRLARVGGRLRRRRQRAARRGLPGRDRRDDPRRRAQRRDVDARVPGRGHGVLQAPRVPPGAGEGRRPSALRSAAVPGPGSEGGWASRRGRRP